METSTKGGSTWSPDQYTDILEAMRDPETPEWALLQMPLGDAVSVRTLAEIARTPAVRQLALRAADDAMTSVWQPGNDKVLSYLECLAGGFTPNPGYETNELNQFVQWFVKAPSTWAALFSHPNATGEVAIRMFLKGAPWDVRNEYIPKLPAVARVAHRMLQMDPVSIWQAAELAAAVDQVVKAPNGTEIFTSMSAEWEGSALELAAAATELGQ